MAIAHSLVAKAMELPYYCAMCRYPQGKLHYTTLKDQVHPVKEVGVKFF